MSIKKITLASFLAYSFLLGIFVDKADPKVATWTAVSLIVLILFKVMHSIFKLQGSN